MTLSKGPRERGWIGWSGGLKLRKDEALAPKPVSPEDGQGAEKVVGEEKGAAVTGAGGEESRR